MLFEKIIFASKISWSKQELCYLLEWNRKIDSLTSIDLLVLSIKIIILLKSRTNPLNIYIIWRIFKHSFIGFEKTVEMKILINFLYLQLDYKIS